MLVLLVSISVLFVAATVAVIITRSRVAEWRLPGQHGLPWSIFASTACLAVVSGLLHATRRAILANRFSRAVLLLRATIAAALVFVGTQAFSVRELTQSEGVFATQTLFVFSFDLLVGLHALHVIGGFVPLTIVHGKAMRREYSSSRHAGLTFCTQYWDYLGVIWLVLLATLTWMA
jgi:cytochrome c oxidase subunit 3